MSDQNPAQTRSADEEQHRARQDQWSLVPTQIQAQSRASNNSSIFLPALMVAVIVVVGGYLVLQSLLPPLTIMNILLVFILAAIVGVGGHLVLEQRIERRRMVVRVVTSQPPDTLTTQGDTSRLPQPQQPGEVLLEE